MMSLARQITPRVPRLGSPALRGFLVLRGGGREQLVAMMKEEDPEHVSQRVAEESWDSLRHSPEGGRGSGIGRNERPARVERKEEVESERQESIRRGVREHELERTGKALGDERDKNFPYEQMDMTDETGGPAKNPLP